MTKCFKCCMFFANGYFNWKGRVLINYYIIKSYLEQKCLWQNVLIVRNCHIAKSSRLNVRCFFIEKCLLKLNKAAYIRHMFCLVFIEEKMAYFSLNISLIRHGPSFDFCVHKHSTGVISDDE
ncbi:hypothetical protein T12_7200 [Trichinella patagoniensis]|uniref:Uncharacterized protein n=1 Tax=Trichinella patagoniensis TaxID=990121 RepID=A0A0V1A003_9BILA|nr:hypothetical protein T12_4897 [Trichinella patagoniensis]KRY18184.1 hypothetical protein T12_7200 [Trichinella patagoniensis]